MARLSRYQRTLLRLQGKPSSDPRDVRRRLRKALETSSRRLAAGGQAEPVQLFGEALDPKKYRQWARRHGGAPELTPGTYALVLHAIPPQHVERFLRRHSYTELFGPSDVGMFDPSVDARTRSPARWRSRCCSARERGELLALNRPSAATHAGWRTSSGRASTT